MWKNETKCLTYILQRNSFQTVKHKTRNSEVIRENEMNAFYDPDVWKDFLNQIPVAQDRRPTTDKWGYTTLKNFFTANKTVNLVNSLHKGREKSYTMTGK